MRGLPGLKARGYSVQVGPGIGAGVEVETFTCCHCNNLVKIPNRATPEQLGRFCHPCNQMTCLHCAQNPECTPFRKKVDQWLARHSASR